ncbi:hypothetical protein BKN14_02845 [Candidatus Gracilibacteria bacterium HOT-871]|nr:hypothetical protein BKN14_02845 [Candidatus Gracilibacteria bacterium HOT-871]
MKISKKAFTLVELVVVLLIISVLAVLGFINYSNYVATGRDSKIIEDLDVISRAINMNLSYGKELISPDELSSETITEDSIQWEQGIFGKENMKRVGSISSLPVNPHTGTGYTYLVSKDKSFYKLKARLSTEQDFIKTNYRDQTKIVKDEEIPPENYVEPQTKSQTVKKGDVVDITKSVANLNDLTNGTKYNWKSIPRTDRVGTRNETIVFVFPNGTKKELQTELTVKCATGYREESGNCIKIPGNVVLYYEGVTAGETITLPIKGSVNIKNINWGDGGASSCPETTTGIVSCKYKRSGNYEIKIDGYFTGYGSVAVSSPKLKEVRKWEGLAIDDLSYAFKGATKLVKLPNDFDTSRVTNMDAMFFEASNFNGDLSSWDVSKVKDMSSMFSLASKFEGKGLEKWKTDSLESMSAIFFKAENFNGEIGNWNVSKVESMLNVFNGARNFNQYIGSWDVSNVMDMNWMFGNTDKFDKPLDNWRTDSLISLESMFSHAKAFNQNINHFNVSKVQLFYYMFNGAKKFNSPLNDWDMSEALGIGSMFYNAESFNQDLDKWDVSKVGNFGHMFYGAKNFNGNVTNWNTSSGDYMGYMFAKAEKFDKPLNWDLNRVGNTEHMFYLARSFNSPLNFRNAGNIERMFNMFEGATKFNQPIANWNISKTGNPADYNEMFKGASSFRQNISNWNINGTCANMFYGASSMPYSYKPYRCR